MSSRSFIKFMNVSELGYFIKPTRISAKNPKAQGPLRVLQNSLVIFFALGSST